MPDAAHAQPLTLTQRSVKRTLDLLVASAALVVTWPLILVAVVVASVDTRSIGLFIQSRVGWRGQPFPLIKIRTMRLGSEHGGSWTTAGDPRITRSGTLMRRYKIDELPQLLNVLAGHMSLVGPRPDVPGFADRLSGEDRLVLSVRPGITGPATLAYRNEEALLAGENSPEEYNRTVLFPRKVRMNVHYVSNYTVRRDLAILALTVRATLRRSSRRRAAGSR